MCSYSGPFRIGEFFYRWDDLAHRESAPEARRWSQRDPSLDQQQTLPPKLVQWLIESTQLDKIKNLHAEVRSGHVILR